jgi:tetratricopeptide (TPR) repeat protein
MEEMVQALFEEGVLQRNGRLKLAKPISSIKVPATVQALLASRIDRLSAPEKQLLQTLAVLGREFTLKLVQRVTLNSNDELEVMLAQLQLGEFINEQPAVGDVEYSFKHALTQEVAYKSLLSERRHALHDQAARVLEELYAEQLEDHYGALAHHYLLSDNTSKAIRYAQLAAKQALGRAAYPQAMSLIETALNLLEKLPENTERSRTELALRSIESTVAMVLHGASSEERRRAILRLCELAESIGTADEFLRALSTLSGLYFTQGESARGLELARRCLTLGQASQDEGLLLDALYNAGMLADRCGYFREAISYLGQAVHRARETNGFSQQWGSYQVGDIGAELAQALQLQGFPEKAVEAAKQALACSAVPAYAEPRWRPDRRMGSTCTLSRSAGRRPHTLRRSHRIVRRKWDCRMDPMGSISSGLGNLRVGAS